MSEIENINFIEIVKNHVERKTEINKTDNELRYQIRLLNTIISKIIDYAGFYDKEIEIDRDCWNSITYLRVAKTDGGWVLRTHTKHGQCDREKWLIDESSTIIEKSLSKLPQFLQGYKKELERRNENLKIENEQLKIIVDKASKMVEDICLSNPDLFNNSK